LFQGGGVVKEETSLDIVAKLEEINKSMTKENIEKATKEELIEYLKQVDEIKALLKTAAEL
jgi:hypothetical protein